MRWSLLVLFFCSACQSKPTLPPAAQELGSSSSKVTAAPEVPPLQLYSLVTASPRRTQDIDSGVVLNPAVQNCFTRPEAPKDAPGLTLQGKVSFLGALEGVKITGADQALEGCMGAALKTISIGRGKIGAFKMRISTDPAKVPGAKGLIIKAPQVKKFE